MSVSCSANAPSGSIAEVVDLNSGAHVQLLPFSSGPSQNAFQALNHPTDIAETAVQSLNSNKATFADATSTANNKVAWLSQMKKNAKGDWKSKTHLGRREMLRRYKFVLKEIDIACGSLFRSRPPGFQFMDVCCSPGGFSEYVLESNNCRGVGLSLPPELGGHVVAIDPAVASPDRYHMYFYDVTTVCSRIRCDSLMGGKQPGQCLRVLEPGEPGLASMQNNMDMMILDGSFLGGKGFYSLTKFERDEDNPAFNVYKSSHAADQCLLVAQLIIMCKNLKPGGSVVMRLSMTWNNFRNGVLCLLRRLFSGSITNYKPRSCHQDKISYYLMCSGFQPNIAQELDVTGTLQRLVEQLRAGGPELPMVPWPNLPEGSKEGLYGLWRPSLEAYYYNLVAFLELVRLVQQYSVASGDPKNHIWQPCWQFMVYSTCQDGVACKLAHENAQLHPFVQEAFSLKNGTLEFPAQARALLMQLRQEGDPKARAAIRLRARQQQLMQERLMAQQQQQQQQQHMMMMAAATGAGATMCGGGLLSAMDQVAWNNMIMRQLLNMYHAGMQYGGGVGALMANPNVFRQSDSVMSDVQQAAMHAGIAARNAASMDQVMSNSYSQVRTTTGRADLTPPINGMKSVDHQRTQEKQHGLPAVDRIVVPGGEGGIAGGQQALLTVPGLLKKSIVPGKPDGESSVAKGSSLQEVSLMQQMQDRRLAALKRKQEQRAQQEAKFRDDTSSANTAREAAGATGAEPDSNQHVGLTNLGLTNLGQLSLPALLSIDDEDEDMDLDDDVAMMEEKQMTDLQQHAHAALPRPAAAAAVVASSAVSKLVNDDGMPNNDTPASSLIVAGPPQISGYFQWLSMIKMTIADDDDGYSLKTLLAFLGD